MQLSQELHTLAQRVAHEAPVCSVYLNTQRRCLRSMIARPYASLCTWTALPVVPSWS